MLKNIKFSLNLFARLLKNTFPDDQNEKFNEKFDEKFKIKVENIVNNHDYSRHYYKIRDCFNIKDLTHILKSLKAYSASRHGPYSNVEKK